MAYGIEVILGFQLDEGVPKLPELALPPQEDDEIYDWWDTQHKIIGNLNGKLQEAHHAACLQMGFQPHATQPKSGVNYPTYQTPLGLRKMSPFHLDYFFDPDEIGDERAEAIIGVGVSSRYFPTFIDWRDPHGGGSTVFFSSESPEMKIAREKICFVLPTFHDAMWIAKLRHY